MLKEEGRRILATSYAFTVKENPPENPQ